MKKKKVLKILIIIILLLIILFFTNRLYTTTIIYKTYSSMLDKAERDEFYIKRTGVLQDSTNILETYIKNNIYKKSYIGIHTTPNTDEKTIHTMDFWRTNFEDTENKYYLIIGTNNEKKLVEDKNVDYEKEPENKMYKYDFSSSLVVSDGSLDFSENKTYSFKDIFIYTLKNTFGTFYTNVAIFSDQDNSFKLHFSNSCLYIDKDTYLPYFKFDDSGYFIYEYSTNSITDEQVQEPEIANY